MSWRTALHLNKTRVKRVSPQVLTYFFLRPYTNELLDVVYDFGFSYFLQYLRPMNARTKWTLHDCKLLTYLQAVESIAVEV